MPRYPTDELHAAISGADAVLTLLHDRVDDGFLDAAGDQLQIVANVAVGYDNIDVPGLRLALGDRDEHARGAHRRDSGPRNGPDPDDDTAPR